MTTDTTPSLYPEYDHAHEMRLVEAIIGAITKASRVGGRGAPILRSTEIIGALVGATAHFLALSDAVRDDDSFEQALDAIVACSASTFMPRKPGSTRSRRGALDGDGVPATFRPWS